MNYRTNRWSKITLKISVPNDKSYIGQCYASNLGSKVWKSNFTHWVSCKGNVSLLQLRIHHGTWIEASWLLSSWLKNVKSPCSPGLLCCNTAWFSETVELMTENALLLVQLTSWPEIEMCNSCWSLNLIPTIERVNQSTNTEKNSRSSLVQAKFCFFVQCSSSGWICTTDPLLLLCTVGRVNMSLCQKRCTDVHRI